MHNPGSTLARNGRADDADGVVPAPLPAGRQPRCCRSRGGNDGGGGGVVAAVACAQSWMMTCGDAG